MLNSAFKCFVFTTLIFLGHSELSAETRITGSDIKSQAINVITDDGAQLELLVSDRRTFFPCSTPLNFTPRIQNDWSSVEITCTSESWSTVLRSTAAQQKNALSVENVSINEPVVVVIKNISKGEVLNSNHLAYEYPLQACLEALLILKM
jgi:flagella basal body P-ring formation protein FlgA